MRLWLLPALLALLAVPGAAACQVTPMLDFVLDAGPCTMMDRRGCDPAPAPSSERVYDGALRWQWDVDECTTQGGMLQGDLVIRLSTTGNNPAWIGVELVPDEIRVPLHDYYDPRYVHLDDGVYSEKEEAFQARFRFEHAPVDEDQQRITQRDGLALLFIKAKAEGEGVRESFAVKAVGFDASTWTDGTPVHGAGPSETVPGLPLLAALGALAVAGLNRGSAGRRRR